MSRFKMTNSYRKGIISLNLTVEFRIITTEFKITMIRSSWTYSNSKKCTTASLADNGHDTFTLSYKNNQGRYRNYKGEKNWISYSIARSGHTSLMISALQYGSSEDIY